MARLTKKTILAIVLLNNNLYNEFASDELDYMPRDFRLCTQEILYLWFSFLLAVSYPT